MELLDPCNFLGNKSVFCSNETTVGWGWSLERSSHDYKLASFSPTPHLFKGEEDWKLVNNRSCQHYEASIKILKVWDSES